MADIPIGAPGIYFKAREKHKALDTAAMDVCAFIGVAPKGPVREPVLPEGWVPDKPFIKRSFPVRRSVAVAVESFDEYLRRFGGFQGPGRLPYAVASFFENGGRRAYVVRIVHDYEKSALRTEDDLNDQGVAEGTIQGATAVSGEIRLMARSEGSWGNYLKAALGYKSLPLNVESVTHGEMAFGIHEPVLPGELLRITLPGGTSLFRFIVSIRKEVCADGSTVRKSASFQYPLPDLPQSIEIIRGELVIEDGTVGYREIHTDLGLSALHPRWMGTVLCYESELVYPAASWIDSEIFPDGADDLPCMDILETLPVNQFSGGRDRYKDIVSQDFFDPGWVLGNERPGDGIHALLFLSDLSTVCVPDLYSPEPLEPVLSIDDPGILSNPDFAPCPAASFEEEIEGESTEQDVQEMEGLRLDPRIPGELARIVSLQKKVVELAEATGRFVALLDVPPGLSAKQIKTWRVNFTSSFSAAYHPWLRTARGDDRRKGLILLNPSAFAAGIIARQEHLYGVPHGPANTYAMGALGIKDPVSPGEEDELHPLGVNLFRGERDGIRLMSARTLSKDLLVRQLSVRRLLMMIRRTLERDTHWMVFEPNGPELRAKVAVMLKSYLRQLFRMGAFKGASEQEAFFVRCDEMLNPPHVVDTGRMVAQIGLAPAEPIEFIILNLVREGDGTLVITE